MSTIKAFRGKIAHNGQERIYLAGGDSDKGYRINRFQVIPKSPTDSSIEGIVMIWKEEQSVLTDQVDFNNDTLIGVAFHRSRFYCC